MPIRRPRTPPPALRHVAFLETMAGAPERTPLHEGAHATLLTLRLLDHWLALGSDFADPDMAAHRAARDAVTALRGDAEWRAALLSILNAVSSLQQPDAQPVLPRVYALGGLIERRGLLIEAGDIYETVARYVDSNVHLDLAFDAHMRRGFCLRNNGAFEWADQAYANAASLAARDRDRVRVIMARHGQAKVEWSRGNLPAADTAMEKLAAEAEELEASRVLAMVLHDRSGVAHDRDDLPRAIRLGYDAFIRTEDDFERERVLLDLANYLSVFGATDSANDALRALEISARSQDLRWSAQINLLALSARSGNEMMFQQYRRRLSEVLLPPRIRVEFLVNLGEACAQFGQLHEARQTYKQGLSIAEEIGANRRIFQIEEALVALEAQEEQKTAAHVAHAKRPARSAAPDDIATALRDLLSEVSGAAA
ncbi:MAG: hypothetical protein OEW77_03285 [Gemmatimonadota bacterium]|nr:hypothetical protein [Gemmatimonadota bacterium]